MVGGSVNWLSNFGNCVLASSQTTDERITQHAHCWSEAEGAELRCSPTDMSERARTTVCAAQSLRTTAFRRRLDTHTARGCYIVTGTQWRTLETRKKASLAGNSLDGSHRHYTEKKKAARHIATYCIIPFL